jgi:hypothetical protein
MARLRLTISAGTSPITENATTKVDIDVDDGVYATEELTGLFETLTTCARGIIADHKADADKITVNVTEQTEYPEHSGAILFGDFPSGYTTYGDITHAGVQNYLAEQEAAG